MNLHSLRTLFQKKLLLLTLSSGLLLLLLACLLTAPLVRALRSEQNSRLSEKDGQATVLTTPPPNDATGLNYRSNLNGTCTITGMGSCTESDLVIPSKSPMGDTVTAIAERAFANCEALISVTIPAEIQNIGEAAFLNCTELVAIEVDRDNPRYSSGNGVLYSKDKTVLYCYPQNRVASKYLLNINVSYIAPYAFYGNRNLEHLLYEETVDSFRDIKIANGNSLLSTITITCNYTGTKT